MMLIGWAVTNCTHLWNDAVILELLLQQSVFLLQCLNLVKSILTNIGMFFWNLQLLKWHMVDDIGRDGYPMVFICLFYMNFISQIEFIFRLTR